MSNVLNKLDTRMLAAAERYARADKSDPFTYNRILSHIENGVASVNNGKDKHGYYDAEEYAEHREYQHEGRTVKYTVPAFKDMVRP